MVQMEMIKAMGQHDVTVASRLVYDPSRSTELRLTQDCTTWNVQEA